MDFPHLMLIPWPGIPPSSLETSQYREESPREGEEHRERLEACLRRLTSLLAHEIRATNAELARLNERSGDADSPKQQAALAEKLQTLQGHQQRNYDLESRRLVAMYDQHLQQRLDDLLPGLIIEKASKWLLLGCPAGTGSEASLAAAELAECTQLSLDVAALVNPRSQPGVFYQVPIARQRQAMIDHERIIERYDQLR